MGTAKPDDVIEPVDEDEPEPEEDTDAEPASEPEEDSVDLTAIVRDEVRRSLHKPKPEPGGEGGSTVADTPPPSTDRPPAQDHDIEGRVERAVAKAFGDRDRDARLAALEAERAAPKPEPPAPPKRKRGIIARTLLGG